MRLNAKIAVILGAPLLVAAVVFVVVVQLVVLTRFAELERQQLGQHHQRLVQALDGEFEELERLAVDWGLWDDAYRYVQGSNPDFVAVNMTPSTFENLQLDAVLIFDRRQRLRDDFSYDRDSQSFVRQPPALIARVAATLAARDASVHGARGLVEHDGGLLQLGISTILDSHGEGTPAGALVMLRRFDAARIERLAERVQLALRLEGPTAIDDAARTGTLPVPVHESPEALVAWLPLRDPGGTALAQVRLEMPRELWRQGRDAVMWMLTGGFGTMLVLALAVFLALRDVVLKRLSRIEATLRDIGDDGNSHARLPVRGNDEIDRLASAINAMLDGLDQAWRERRQSAERQRELNALLVGIATDERLALGDEESLFRVLTGSLGQGAPLDRWSLWLHHPDAGPPTCWRISVSDGPLRPTPAAALIGTTLQAWNEEEGVALPLVGEGLERHALLLPFAVDMWRGALVVEAPAGAGPWAEDEVNFLLSATTLVQRSLDAHFMHVRERTLRQQAELDPLTGLANRATFTRATRAALARCRRGGDQVALLFVDLDCFKPVNDQHGHAVGDWLLRQVAERIRCALRARDLVARLGGDEFTVLLDHPREDAAGRIADKLVAALAEPFVYNDLMLTIGCSIGIAFAPRHGLEFDELLHAADMAMYSAKQSGRNTWRVCEAA
jgi:diguanylate cyclase (GGDEF)-like protein